MQAPPTSQRSIQRRSPAADPGPPPTVPARAISPGPGSQPRTPSSSAKPVANGGSRRQNASQPTLSSQAAPPLSQIEKSVTHLLVATKQLLETLTQWSRHQATDAQVSDVYVRLGYEFNIACRAFTAINVDVSDLGNVPELLRHILESTLSQEASVDSLEKYLPRIRDIIINLLHGLKRKQQKLRQKQSREGSSSDLSVPRNGSVNSVNSGDSRLTNLLDQGISNNFRDGSVPENRDGAMPNEIGVPARGSSSSANPARRGPPGRDPSRASFSTDPSTLSSSTMQSMPILPPYPSDESQNQQRAGSEELNVDSFPPPPPPPKQQNALAALQRGGDLERRASRRYSAYQIQKHLGIGASPNGVPLLPPAAQNSPIPNRGRNDARESMRAVQTRGDQRHNRQQSRATTEASPVRIPSSVLEEESKTPVIQAPDEQPRDDSPTAKTPEDKIRQPPVNFDAPSATLRGPPTDALPLLPGASPDGAEGDQLEFPETSKMQQQATSVSLNQDRQFTPELSPPPTKELTVFLQYKSKVKKFVLTDGYNDLSMARLQLAFIEKFAWNTHNNGVDLPEIYIQDPISGVRHELEDLHDIKDRSVLVLNIEVLDEVKRHIDEGIGGLRSMMEVVKTSVEDNSASIQRVSERQNDTARDVARIAAAPLPRVSYDNQRNSPLISPSKINTSAQMSEIQSLRRDLAVLRQTYSGFQSDIQNSMSIIRAKASSVKSVAIKATVPDITGDSGRSYINIGKKQLNEESDKLVKQVDDLQDIVEDLRKDVVTRGVRPLPRQLETVAKDLSQATIELKKMQEYMKRERPIWTKIWEKELETVCNDREEVTMQEELATDLQDDLEKAAETFRLVEQATKEQMKDTPGSGVRILGRGGLNHVVIPAADPSLAKEGVLGEVRALQPNHENRLEAIERAEKLRQRELESRRGGEFQKELGTFVEEGKLKKAGGFEEVERARKAKDERIRREVWERQNGMTQADAVAEAMEEPLSPNPEANEETQNGEGEAPADI
ncbi:AIP3 domain containing protein [Hyaloscypha variabilis]